MSWGKSLAQFRVELGGLLFAGRRKSLGNSSFLPTAGWKFPHIRVLSAVGFFLFWGRGGKWVVIAQKKEKKKREEGLYLLEYIRMDNVQSSLLLQGNPHKMTLDSS